MKKEIMVYVIDLKHRHLFDIEVEQSHDISNEDFIRLAKIKDYVFTLEQFESIMNDLEPFDFDHCFMRFI
jgi:hypothetical protein